MQAVNNNPYATLWNEKVSQNGWLTLPLMGLCKVFMYIVCARFVVTFAQWLLGIARNVVEGVLTLLLAAGKCAESLFIVSTFYVLCYAVARPLLIERLGLDGVTNINHIVLIIFTALPELILLDAIKTSVERVYRVSQLWDAGKKKRAASIVWASFTVVPTGFFVVLTIYTLASFAGSTEHQFDMAQLTGFALLFRILPGWGYAIVNGLYDKFGKEHYTNFIDEQKQAIADRDALLQQREDNHIKMINERDNAVQTLINANESLQSDVEFLQAQLRDLEQELLILKARKQPRKNVVIQPETGASTESIKAVKDNSSTTSTQSTEPIAVSELNQSNLHEYSVTEVVAAEILGIPIRSVSRLIGNDTLKHAPNSSKITMKSIEKYAMKKGLNLKQRGTMEEASPTHEPAKSEQNTDELPTTSNGNGHSKETVNLNEYPELLV